MRFFPSFIWLLNSAAVLAFQTLVGQAGYHMDLLSHISIPERSSSIWGYTDANGNEFALLGTSEGVRIFSLSDPYKPRELGFIRGTSSPWRELKTAGHYAYVTTEASDGLLVINLLSPLDSLPYRFVKSFQDSHGETREILSAHTIFVDDQQRIFLAGAKPIGTGFAILDPRSDPYAPVFLYESSEDYCHEVYAYKNRLYAAELFNGLFSIWDLSDPQLPIRISDQPTSGSFTHSVWLDHDHQVLYTTDETDGAVVESWDVSDPFTIRKLDAFKVQDSAGLFPIPHNVFYKEGRLYVSYYTEGVRVLDVSDPSNLLEVAWYDTHETYSSGFHGCWSAYPFFPSGICIASDIENGLYVMRYDGNAAATLKVSVRDHADQSPILNAKIEITQATRQVVSFTTLNGTSNTGFPEAGKVGIHVRKKGYYEHAEKLFLRKDQPNEISIELSALPRYQLQLHISDRRTKLPIAHSKIVLYNSDFRYEAETDLSGLCTISGVYEGDWNLVSTKWAYRAAAQRIPDLKNDLELMVEMDSGYEDDFITDLGWTSEGIDTIVRWKRGDFSELSYAYSNFPIKDLPGDNGNNAMYTDNYDRISDPEYCIQGELLLNSPRMDLSPYATVDISYHAWAYGGYNSRKEIYLRTNDRKFLLEEIPENLSGSFNPESRWQVDLHGLDVDSSYLIIKLYNDPDSFNNAIRLIAAFDGFRLDGQLTDVHDDAAAAFSLYPNPCAGPLYLELFNPGAVRSKLYISNLFGQVLFQMDIKQQRIQEIEAGRKLPAGVYVIGISGSSRRLLLFKTS